MSKCVGGRPHPSRSEVRSLCGVDTPVRRPVVKIDHSCRATNPHYGTMKVTEKQALAVRCPTCGAKVGEKCELSTGQPRTDPHRDRRLAASDQ
jgi:hypothetical protein